jgi:acetyl-CoA carboxylase beta subunit
MALITGLLKIYGEWHNKEQNNKVSMTEECQEDRLHQAEAQQELSLQTSQFMDAHQMIMRFQVERIEQKTNQLLQSTNRLEASQTAVQKSHENIKQLAARLEVIESQLRQQRLTDVSSEKLVNLIQPFTEDWDHDRWLD